MARGFLSGILWGGMIGATVSGVASVLAPLPTGPEIADAAPAAAEAPARVEQASSGETGSESDRAPVTGQVAPQTQVPDADTIAALENDAMNTANQPQTGEAGGLEAPTAATETAELSVDGEAPVIPSPLALAPMEPEPVDDVAIRTEPAAPPPPSKEKIAGSFDAPAQPAAQGAQDTVQTAITTTTTAVSIVATAPQAPQSPVSPGDTQGLADSTVTAPPTEATEIAALTQELQVKPLDPPITVITQAPAQSATETDADQPADAPSAVVPDALPDVSEEPAVKPVETAETDATETEAPETEAQQAEAQETAVTEQAEAAQADGSQTETTQTETAPAQTQTQEAQAQDSATEAPQPAQTEQGAPVETVAVVRRALGTPSITLTDRNNGVTINRSIVQQTQGQAATVATPQPEDGSQPSILKYAQTFENTSDKPLMSIVLIDDGTSVVAGANGIAALRSFPYPLSFAVDTSLKDAAERMATYRKEGLEVLAMIDLPEGALPTDAEITLGAILPAMDGVVGVLEGTRGGLQGSRDVADQVTAILAQSGHGLLTQDKGLNTMPKLARKEGVPAEPVFRDFDSKGQTPQVIRRFLDQAAFKAGQEGAVVMLGRMRPDTISALLLWGLQDRAGKVALAPISAVLTREP